MNVTNVVTDALGITVGVLIGYAAILAAVTSEEPPMFDPRPDPVAPCMTTFELTQTVNRDGWDMEFLNREHVVLSRDVVVPAGSFMMTRKYIMAFTKVDHSWCRTAAAEKA